MMRELLLLFLIYANNIYSQVEHRESTSFRPKFFIEGSAFIGVEDPPGKSKHIELESGNTMITNSISLGLGVSLSGGQKWFFKEGDHGSWTSQLTWLKLGVFGGDASGIGIAPLNFGLGYFFDLSKKSGIEPIVQFCPVILSDDIFNPTFELKWANVFGIKYASRKFYIGTEYMFKPSVFRIQGNSENFHFFSINIGGFF